MKRFPPIERAMQFAMRCGSDMAVDFVQIDLARDAAQGSPPFEASERLYLFSFYLVNAVMELLESSDSEVLQPLRETADEISSCFLAFEKAFPSDDYRKKVRKAYRKMLEGIGELDLLEHDVQQEKTWERRRRERPERERRLREGWR